MPNPGGVPAEVFLRYVIRDNSRLRFQVGLGVTWVSLRLRISTRQNRADGRVSDVLGPSFGYLIAIELIPPLVVFAESCTALLSPDGALLLAGGVSGALVFSTGTSKTGNSGALTLGSGAATAGRRRASWCARR